MEHSPVPIPLLVALLGVLAAFAASASGAWVQAGAVTAILGAVALLGAASLRPQRQRQPVRVRTQALPPRRR
jgi:hypothetical protein